VHDLVYLFRFFRVVPPISGLMTSTFAVLTAAGAALMAWRPDDAVAAAIPVIVLQAFSAASGFASPARRGYFDLLLASGEPRLRIAIVQWITAITPGVASWGVLATLRAVLHGAVGNPLLAAGTLLALWMVSTIPWAITVSLPRFSGAIGWLLLVSLWSISAPIWPAGVGEVLFPLAIVGDSTGRHVWVFTAGAGLSVITMAGALAWVHRTDIPLEAAQ
jgi:hypothetical protein